MSILAWIESLVLRIYQLPMGVLVQYAVFAVLIVRALYRKLSDRWWLRPSLGALLAVWFLSVLWTTVFSRGVGAHDVRWIPLYTYWSVLHGGNRELLRQGRYDGAFCLDSYDYRTQLKTRLYTPDEADSWADSKAPKSRYLPVSQEETVRYIRRHLEARLIIVGTSCALRGIEAVIRKLNRNRENYLLIGLFCGKVFNYNVLSFWQDQHCGGAALRALHFKNKESGGWPGDMKFFPENGESFYVPLQERAQMKRYFMPERCLYCVDKLNALADISLGDNYTNTASSPLGSNSVMLRTVRGLDAWNAVRELIEAVPVDITEIQEAQGLSIRLQNLYYGDLTGLELNPGVPREQPAEPLKKARALELQRLRCGTVYDQNPSALHKQSKRDNTPPPLPIRAVRFAGRKLRALWRKLHS